MLLNRDAIARLVPHAGAMCLLDAVVSWDAERVVCRTARHADANNPLAVDGRLSSLAGIEFAAQAMAVHAALVRSRAAEAPHPASRGAFARGALARVRDCTIARPRLDRAPVPLLVTAERIAATSAALAYRFRLHAGDLLFVEGSALIAVATAPMAATVEP
jgi:predicted hotdog family 3-hydroxylacyl-ACP dehydratase